MKVKYFSICCITIVALFCVSCSNNSTKPDDSEAQIPLLEVKNGDTITTYYELKPEDVAVLLEDGYKFNEYFGYYIVLSNKWEDNIEADLNLIVAHAASALNIGSESVPFDKLKIIDGSKDDIYYGYCFVQPIGDYLLFGYFDKEEPYHATYTILDKEEAYDAIKDVKTKVNHDFSDEQYLIIAGLAFIKRFNGPYYTALSFKSKSNINTRMLFMCGKE